MGRLAAGLLAGGLGLRLPCCQLGLVLGLLPFIPLFGAGFDLGAGLRKLRQTLLAARQFIRDRHAVGHIRVLIRQCAVPAGIGVDLRAVERNGAHLEHPHLVRQRQHLHEQTLELLEKAPPKRRDRVVIRMLVRCDEAECHRIVSRPLQLSAREHTRRIPVHQKAK